MPVTDGLSPEARALLDAARDGLSPDPAAVHRVRARIQLATAGGAAGTALAVKLIVVAVIATVGGTALVIQSRQSRHGEPAPVALPAVELPSPPERPQPIAVHEAASPSAAQSGDEDLITIEPVPVARERSQRPGRPAPLASSPAAPREPQPAAPAPASEPARGTNDPTGEDRRPAGKAIGVPTPRVRRSPIGLGREVELVDLAMAALRRGDAHGALRIIHDYAAEAADQGQLTQDAAAIEIEALCSLRDPAAHDKLAAFDARFPRSAQRPRLDAACR